MTQPTPVAPVVPGASPAPPGAILDYASPGLKKKLRLPSRSILTFHVRDHELAVVESVEAKGSAVAGLVFAGFVLLWVAFIMAVSRKTYVVLGPLWLAEFTTLLLVVHDTWRTTILTVTPAGLDLRFATPFRKRAYHWPATDFRHVLAFATDVSKSPPLGVLTLSLGPSTVRLFDGHDHDQLVWLATAIQQALQPTSSIPQSAIRNPQ